MHAVIWVPFAGAPSIWVQVSCNKKFRLFAVALARFATFGGEGAVTAPALTAPITMSRPLSVVRLPARCNLL